MENKIVVNSGVLFSQTTKQNPKAPDYRGDVTVDIRSLDVKNNVATIKLAGWKKIAKSGKQYLSLSVDTYKREEEEKSDDFE